jgi:hypothetical protein
MAELEAAHGPNIEQEELEDDDEEDVDEDWISIKSIEMMNWHHLRR